MHDGNSFRFVAALLLLLIFCTTGFSQTISKSLFSLNKETQQKPNPKMISLEKLIKKIESDQHIVFLYKTMWLKDKYVPATTLEQDSLEFKLGAILQKEGLTYSKITSRSFAIQPQTDKGNTSSKQSMQVETVTGTVTDAQSGETLPGVNVMVKGTTTGTSTGSEGMYELNAPSLQDTLIFSFVGYQTREVPIEGRTTIDIALQAQAIAGEELVVVGYGTQQKEDLTGSISSVSKERLDNSVAPSDNIFQVLKGAVSGLRISQSSSSASGASQSILIRGRNSINASNSPLIVLDGAPYDGTISSIATSEVENISVLKGPSATAIYGSRGSNGVILVTTKQGQGDLKVTYEGSIETQKAINIPDLLNGQEFYEFKTTRVPGSMTPSEQEVYENNAGVDWLDLALQRGFSQNHSLSFSGGNENINYFINGSGVLTKGIAVNDIYNRYSIRANVNASVTDWLSLTSNSQLARVIQDGSDANFGSAFYMNPLTTAYQENGALTIYPWPEKISHGNPLAPTKAINENQQYQVITNNTATIRFPFLEGLQYKLNTSIQYTHDRDATYYKRSNTRVGFEQNGRASNSNSTSNHYLVENVLSYERDFGKHNVAFTGLFSYQLTRATSTGISGSGFQSDILTNYQYDQAGVVDPSTGFHREALLSNMLRVHYGYDNRYLVTLTGRRDGYNGFGENNLYGIFPSGAVSWNISNEDFFNSDIFSNLKLRVAYGANGNQAIGVNERLARFRSRNYEFGENLAPGYIPSQLSNPELSWESTTTLNVGLDFGLWNSRLSGGIDIYNSKTNDLLFNRIIPSVLGISSITQNIGSTQNRGIELSLSSLNIEHHDFSWHTQITGSFNKNKILSLVGDEDIIGNSLFIGKPIRANYDYVYDGVWQEGDDIATSAQPTAEPGYAKVKDVNGDGGISPDDRTIQGQRDPKYIFGMANTFSYRNFSLYIFFQGQAGSKRDNPLTNDNVWTEVERNTVKKNWWTPDNPTNDHWANDPDANIHGVDILQSDAFIRLKYVTFSYTVGNEWLSESGLSQLKIYATGQNLATITNWTGLDPELSSQRAVPLTRNFTLGINLSF